MFTSFSSSSKRLIATLALECSSTEHTSVFLEMSAVPYQVAGADFDQWFGEEILKQDGVSVRSQAYALMKLVGSIDSAGHVIPSRFAEAEEC